MLKLGCEDPQIRVKTERQRADKSTLNLGHRNVSRREGYASNLYIVHYI